MRSVPEKVEASCHVDKEAQTLIADPDLLKRILSNLVNNAVQAMPEGGKLALRTYREEDDFVITVQDTGVAFLMESRLNCLLHYLLLNLKDKALV